MRPTHVLKRSLLAVVLAAAGLVAVPGAAHAQDTTAVAINTRDDSSVFRLAFDIRRVMNDVVDTSNAAVAFSSCDSCQTTAIALQVVLIMSDPEIVAPENVAIAINSECTSCESVASAYQYVLTTGGAVHFTPEGNQLLADLRQQLLDLRDSDLTPEELLAAVDEIAEQLAAVIDNELVPAAPPEEVVAEETPIESSTTTPAPVETSSTTESTTEPTTEPSTEPTTSPEATPTSSTTPAPEPSPSSTP